MTPESQIVEIIIERYRGGSTVAEIATLLKLTECEVQYVIDHGAPPKSQLQWAPDP